MNEGYRKDLWITMITEHASKLKRLRFKQPEGYANLRKKYMQVRLLAKWTTGKFGNSFWAARTGLWGVVY